jgi:hypothetical protein
LRFAAKISSPFECKSNRGERLNRVVAGIVLLRERERERRIEENGKFEGRKIECGVNTCG